MGNPKAALQDSKKVIDLAPERWQGYARAARLFLKGRKPDAAFKMIHLALERIKVDDSKRRVELEEMREQVLDAQERNRLLASSVTYHFAKLPVEIFAEIFTEVVAPDPSRVLVLSSVCKQWRGISLHTPAMWRKLVLTGRRPVTKAKTWSERSNGTIGEIHVRPGAASHLFTVFEVIGRLSLGHLRIFQMEQCDEFFQRPLSMAHVAANLEHLQVSSSKFLRWDSRFLSQFTGGKLRSLCMEHGYIVWDTLCAHIKNFVSLEVRESFATGSLITLLAANPLLERVVVDIFGHLSEVDAYPTERIHLNHLTHLAFGPNIPLLDIFRHVTFPSLRILHLFSAGCLDQALDALTQQGTPLVTTLKIQSSPVDPSTLINFLTTVPLLEALEISHVGYVANPLLEALGNYVLPSLRDDEPACETKSPICPSLIHLNLANCPDLKTGPLVRLVKSRLAGTTEQRSVARVETLVVDGCPLVESEALPWLRSKVPQFSCVYMSKKQAKKWTR